MGYEATIFDGEGKAIGEAVGIFDRAWLLNAYEQATFRISAKRELERLGDFQFGNYLAITDSALPIWGGYCDPPQSWASRGSVMMQAYSAEKLFEWRAYPGELVLNGTAGGIFRMIVENLNTILPWPTLIRPGSIYDEGASRQERISAKKLYDDVLRISARSRNDFYCEPVVENGMLHFEAHWYERRGETKDFALEEGVNIEAKENVMEKQGPIWNYIFAFGNASTWLERETATAFDATSIEDYGPRMYPLAVNSNDPVTVQAAADAFLSANKAPPRSFNLTASPNRLREDEVYKVFKTLRIGDIVDLKMYKIDFENGKLGVDTRVRVRGMIHRGRRNILDLNVNELRTS
jgi:hypothetical protein